MISQSSKLTTMPLGFTHNDIYREVFRNTEERRKGKNPLSMMSQSIKLATMPLGFPYNDTNREVLKNIKDTQKRA